jgi:hypothetical protein
MKLTITFLFALVTALSFAQIPQNGLIFYLPFNGNITDVGPNANTGNLMTTNSGGVTLDADKSNNPNKCYYFGGGYLDFGINDKLAIGENSFTFVAWFCQTTYSGIYSIFTNNLGFGGGMSIGLKSGAIFTAVGGGTMPNSISVNVVNDGNYRWNDWHHVAVVLDRSTKKFCIYVDGIKKPILNDTSYGPYGGTISGNELDFTGLPLNLTSMNTNAVGAYLANGRVYQNFLGLLDDIALYNRALSQSEITGIFSGTTALRENATNSNKRIFLNSTKEMVCIKGLETNAKLTVFNMNGVMVASSVGQAIHISNLPKGLYLLKVNDGTSTFSEKFTK